MGIQLIKGRLFTDHDDATAPRVVLINETLARRFFPGQDPLGKRLKLGLNDINGEIVGVVGDVRDRALNREALPEYYLPCAHVTIDSMSITVRAKTGDPMNLAFVGIFSVMSFLVAQRAHEIGVRTALGAQRRDVLKLILGQGMKLTLIGILIGLILAFALTRLMREFLYQVD